eukprot:3467410-Pyramimonas_sp.AAC.1
MSAAARSSGKPLLKSSRSSAHHMLPSSPRLRTKSALIRMDSTSSYPIQYALPSSLRHWMYGTFWRSSHTRTALGSFSTSSTS